MQSPEIRLKTTKLNTLHSNPLRKLSQEFSNSQTTVNLTNPEERNIKSHSPLDTNRIFNDCNTISSKNDKHDKYHQ